MSESEGKPYDLPIPNHHLFMRLTEKQGLEFIGLLDELKLPTKKRIKLYDAIDKMMGEQTTRGSLERVIRDQLLHLASIVTKTGDEETGTKLYTVGYMVGLTKEQLVACQTWDQVVNRILERDLAPLFNFEIVGEH